MAKKKSTFDINKNFEALNALLAPAQQALEGSFIYDVASYPAESFRKLGELYNTALYGKQAQKHYDAAEKASLDALRLAQRTGDDSARRNVESILRETARESERISKAPRRGMEGLAGTAATMLGAAGGMAAPAAFGKFAAASAGLGGGVSALPSLFKTAYDATQRELSREEKLEPWKQFKEGAARGLGRSLPIYGVVGATDPLLHKFLVKTGIPTQRALSQLGITGGASQQVVERAVPAFLNVLQGAPVDIAIGEQPLSPESLAIDIGTGGLFKSSQFQEQGLNDLLRGISGGDILKGADPGFIRIPGGDEAIQQTIKQSQEGLLKQLEFTNPSQAGQIAEIMRTTDTSGARMPSEAMQKILQNLPEHLRKNADITTVFSRWGKSGDTTLQYRARQAGAIQLGPKPKGKEAPKGPTLDDLKTEAKKFKTLKEYLKFLEMREAKVGQKSDIVRGAGYKSLVDFYNQAVKGEIPKYAPINLNLTKVDSPKQIKSLINTWSIENKQALDTEYQKFGGKNFMEEIRRLAADNRMNVDDIMKGKKYNISTPAGQKDLLKDVMILRDTNAQNYKDLNDLSLKLAQTDDPIQKAILSDQIVKKNAEVLSVRLELQGRTKLAGQFLNLFNQLTKAQGIPDAGDRAIAVEKVLKKQFGLNEEQLTKAVDGYTKINQTDPDAVGRWMTDVAAMSNKKSSYLLAYYYNNILSSPTTHSANFVGNSFSLLANELAVRPTAMVFQGKSPKEIMRTVGPAWAGAFRAFPGGVARGWNILRTGFDPDEVIRPDKWTAFDVDPYTISGNRAVRAAAPVLSGPTRLLKGADAMFKNVLYGAELNSRIAQKAMEVTKSNDPRAIGEASEQIKNNLKDYPDLVENSWDYAYYGTFNQAPSRFTKHLEDMRRDVPVLRPVIPFLRIADNLFRQAFVDYSPAGFFIKKPNLDAIQQSQMNARALLGTMLMTVGATEYLNGNITLSPPKEPGAQANFYQRTQPYSMLVQVGGRTAVIPIRRLEPFSNTFFIGAMIAKNIQEGVIDKAEAETTIREHAENVGNALFSTVQETGQYALQASYLQNIQKLLDGFSTGYTAEADLQQLIGSTAGGMIPGAGLLRSLSYALDPVYRKAETATDYLMTQTPWSQNVQPRITPFGQEAKRPMGRWAGALFIRPKYESRDPVVQEMHRLNVNVSLAKPEIRGVKLEGDAKTAYQKMTGRMVHYYLLQVTTSPEYQQLNDEAKKEIVDKTIRAARDSSRTAYINNVRSFEQWLQLVSGG